MSQRQRDDMVILAHTRDQHRFSLRSYGRFRMIEELQELGLTVGYLLPAGNCAANCRVSVLVKPDICAISADFEAVRWP